MALCCIGGVCIPYSALLPFLAYGFQWLLTKLVAYGILPDWLHDRLQGMLPAKKTTKRQSESCCTSTTCSTVSDSSITSVQSMEQWAAIVQSSKPVVCKWTASWCQPCKKIQPLFESLAEENDGVFCIIDVDDMEDLASEYNVAMMPTFLVLKDQVEVARYAGSDENKLRKLISENL
jgi:thioredoxin 1